MNSIAILEHGPVRLKACRYGPLLYWITDTYIGQSLDMYGEFSEGETALLRQIIRPGATVVEVGANIGAHTVCLAKAVGNTLCVPANVQQNLAGFKEITDPQESAAGMLRANRERQAAEGK